MSATGGRVSLIHGGDNNPIQGVTEGCADTRAGGQNVVSAGQKLGGPDLYYDPCQFVPAPLGFFGTVGKNTLITPGLATIDLSFVKNFGVTETTRAQFRAEFFNLFNRPNFGDPDITPFSSNGGRDVNAGKITETITSPRQLQLGLRYIF